MFRTVPIRQEARDLLHRGGIVFGEIERNGIRVDVDYCKQQQEELFEQTKELKRKILGSELGKAWKRRYGRKLNFDSPSQVSSMLFDEFGIEPTKETQGGKASSDKESLLEVDIPEVRDILQVRLLSKLRGTFLNSLIRETLEDGYMHPTFSLHIPVSYRSSSADPNFQNFPIRDPLAAKVIRSAIRSRKGHRIVEADYSGIEVRVAACYHKDPVMLSYIKDPSKDMHRDMAAECFKLPASQVTKQSRYCGKNMFVFPQFYGDYYVKCASSLWSAITRMELATVSGIPMHDHLQKKGILSEASFENHIKKVEDRFWNERFRRYTKWKKQWFASYQRNGFVPFKTGFVAQGFLQRNKVINLPIQGSAFHCLLSSAIRLFLAMKKRKMKSVIIGQIHDSIVSDVAEEEFDDYVELIRKIMIEDLLKQWEWIITPLDIEVEASPVNGSWYEKAAVN